MGITILVIMKMCGKKITMLSRIFFESNFVQLFFYFQTSESLTKTDVYSALVTEIDLAFKAGQWTQNQINSRASDFSRMTKRKYPPMKNPSGKYLLLKIV